MISVRGEARIYRLPSIELVDIVTWAQIMKSLIKIGTPKKLLDITRIKKLGWKPAIGLKTGIRLYYKWYSKRGN